MHHSKKKSSKTNPTPTHPTPNLFIKSMKLKYIIVLCIMTILCQNVTSTKRSVKTSLRSVTSTPTSVNSTLKTVTSSNISVKTSLRSVTSTPTSVNSTLKTVTSSQRRLKEDSVNTQSKTYDVEGTKIPCQSGVGITCICPSCAYQNNGTCILRKCQKYSLEKGCESKAPDWIAAWFLAVFLSWTGAAFAIIKKWSIFYIILFSTVAILLAYCCSICQKEKGETEAEKIENAVNNAKCWTFNFQIFCCGIFLVSIIFMAIYFVAGKSSGGCL